MAVEKSPEVDRVALRSETLYAVIGVVASAPDLDRVLDRIVDLLTEATACHACFVYLRDGERLRLRAASRVYAHLVGRVDMGLDEGLAGWVARNGTPEFIREHAMTDPRMKYVPEIEEERFQSMVAVPIPARSGSALGTVVLHTVAPREFDEGVLTFLAHTASLVAGAIENARLYEDTRRRVEALTRLSSLTQAIAAIDGREELYRVVTDGVRELLRCDACQLYLLDAETGRLEPAGARPAGRPAARGRARGPGGGGVVPGRRRGQRGPARHAAPPRGARGRAGRHAADRARGGRRRATGRPCLDARGPTLLPGGRRAAAGGRKPARGRAAQGAAHRAPDGREHRPRPLRGARARQHRRRGGARPRGRVRPAPPASAHPRRAGAGPRRPAAVARGGRADRGAAAPARARRPVPHPAAEPPPAGDR